MARCKFCETEGFSWKETPEGFRMIDEFGSIHNCSKRPKKPAVVKQCKKCNADIKFKAVDADTGKDHVCQKN